MYIDVCKSKMNRDKAAHTFLKPLQILPTTEGPTNSLEEDRKVTMHVWHSSASLPLEVSIL